MEKYYWNPTREDRVGVCMGIFQHDGVDRKVWFPFLHFIYSILPTILSLTRGLEQRLNNKHSSIGSRRQN